MKTTIRIKMTKAIYATVILLLFACSVFAQSVGINADGSSPNSKAMLDVSSTTKGLLPPRMTYAQKIAITSPPAGLMVWCTNCGTFGELQVFNGAAWTNLIGGAASGSVPGAPTGVSATAGDGQASVSFTQPASNGGSPITTYTATSNPGSFTGTLSQAGSGTITVAGLTNGTPYTFTVKATNINGTGAASDPSNSVTPATVPGAPTGVSATAGNGQASVSFTAPASNGGSPITSYTATSDPGNITGILNQAGSGTITVSGLTNGTAYTFTVTATNSKGTGAASTASNSVTPATVPGAPIIGTATSGTGQASVPFTAPGSNGGSTITSYTATSTPGNFTGTLTQAGSGTITVTGLTPGTTYTFTVTATNAIGTGAASAASNSVTPVASLAIGQSYGGGILAYILQPGDPNYISGETHGLIAATADQGGPEWGCYNTSISGAKGTALGTGRQNTVDILAGCPTTGIAARLCDDYSITVDGTTYSDWYLPSKDELAKLYAMKVLGFGGFENWDYWSSSEWDVRNAWYHRFTNDYQTGTGKSNWCLVRAVRSF
ncbi:MAG: fibronectin type III domain-containing protein [Mariniphaga sp.]